MTKTLQLLGGTTAQNDAFTGASREVTVDTQTHELRVHDGSTAGGFVIPTKSALAAVATSGLYSDLSGTPTIPTTLAELTGDVSLTSPTDGQVLTYDNGDWINADATGGYHPDIFDWKWADHELNDVQWLRADTFSWQSGAVYQAAYQHLVDDITGKTATSETVGGVTISFYLADDGHKITTDETAVAQIYTATGVAWYYVLDTVNQRFKLPRKRDKGVPVIRQGSRSDGAWYRLYADGWVEQGNNQNTSNTTITYPVVMRDTSYTLCDVGFTITNRGAQTVTKTTTGFSTGFVSQYSYTESWMVFGWSAEGENYQYDGKKYLYFYVGNFTQTALENTAGLNAELFNDKVDVGHEVILFQAPTADNNYTWYRKYADGWVEQGGVITGLTNASTSWILVTVNLPITMSGSVYTVTTSGTGLGTSAGAGCRVDTLTTTNFAFRYYNAASSSVVGWQVSGMAAN